MAALDGLLERTISAHSDVNAAVAAIQRCTEAGAAAGMLRDAAAVRRELDLAAGALDVTALPGGERILASFRGAMTASAEADDAFAVWGDQVAQVSCTTSPDNVWFDEGIAVSRTARAYKQDFVDAWNPIARQYGLLERDAPDL